MAIPVICDRCRATGFAGEADFCHFGDLLEFEPVPRRPRVNGWDAEAQRAFIALLAATGSKRRAALAIGRNAHGIEQLLKAKGSDSFKAAFDRALAIAREKGLMTIALGVADAAARTEQLTPPSRLRGLAPAPLAEDGGEDVEEGRAELEALLKKFLLKVLSERKARLAGQIVAADFYLRQITWFEVAIDLAAERIGRDPFELLLDLRRGGDDLLAIAETPFSRLLDERRRLLWAHLAEPERPEHPPRRCLEDNGDHSSEPLEIIHGGEDYRAKMAEFEARHAADAESQIAWERQAAADAAEWRAAQAT